MSFTFQRLRPYRILGSLQGRTGLVRAVGRQLADDGGAFRPVGATFFWLPWGVRRDPDRTAANVADLAQKGADFVRALGEVGGESWEDRTIDPTDPNFTQDLAAAIDLAAARGLRVALTIFGGGLIKDAAGIALTTGKVIDAIGPRLEHILLVEISNEDNFAGSDDEFRLVARRLRAAFPSLVISTNSDDLARTSRFLAPDGCNAMNLHSDRTVGDLGWRTARQLWGISYPSLLVALEPPGMHLGQGQDVNDPVRLAFIRAVGLLSGFQAFVLHSGPGVRGGGAYDKRYGRATNFYDLADLRDGFAALQAVDAIIPAGVADWRKTHQHGREPFADNFLYADAIWSDEGETHGVSRNYVAYDGAGNFCCLAFGVKGYADWIARRAVTGQLHDMRSGDVSQIAIPAGGRYQLAGDDQANAAYILVGTVS